MAHRESRLCRCVTMGGSNIEERQAESCFWPIKFVERRAIGSLGVVLRAGRSIPVMSFVQAVLFAGWALSCRLFDSDCQPKLILGNAWRGRTSKCGTPERYDLVRLTCLG
jgi:hypothetical protein